MKPLTKLDWAWCWVSSGIVLAMVLLHGNRWATAMSVCSLSAIWHFTGRRKGMREYEAIMRGNQ